MNDELETSGAVALIQTFLDCAALIEQRLDRALSNTRGVSYREFQLLLELSRCHDGTAMRVELAEAVGVTPSAVTRALKPLEKLGYVSTEKSDRDARRSLAKLTCGGADLLADTLPVAEDVVANLPLPLLDPEKLTAFRRALADTRGIQKGDRPAWA